MTAYIDQVGSGAEAHFVMSCCPCGKTVHLPPSEDRRSAQDWADEHNAKHEEAWRSAIEEEEGLL